MDDFDDLYELDQDMMEEFDRAEQETLPPPPSPPRTNRSFRSRSPSPRKNDERSRSRSVGTPDRKSANTSVPRRQYYAKNAVNQSVETKLAVWKFLIEGDFSVAALRRIPLQRVSFSSGYATHDLDEQEENAFSTENVTELFKRASLSGGGVSCFCASEEVVQFLEMNFSLNPDGAIEAAMRFTDVHEAINSFYDYFGGNKIQHMNFFEKSTLALLRFPVENFVAINQTGRRYMRILCGLQIYLDSKRHTATQDEQNDCFFKMASLAKRIRALRAMRAASCDIDKMFAVSRSTPFVRMSSAMYGDVRAVHDISGGSFLHAFKIFQRLVPHTGAVVCGGDIYLPRFVEGSTVFANAYKRYTVTKGSSLSAKAADVLPVLIGGLDEAGDDFETIVAESGHLDRIVSVMLSTKSPYLPEIKLDPSLRSFRNGVYDALRDEFYPHKSKRIPGVSCEFYSNVNFDRELMEPQFMDPLNFKGKFKKRANSMDVDEEEDDDDIETTNPRWWKIFTTKASSFHKLVSYQFPVFNPSVAGETHSTYRNPNQILRFVYAMLGRSLFEVNLIEPGFEQILALIGIAGVGKSKLLGVITNLVSAHAVIKSNPEKQFGYSNLVKKSVKLLITDEIDRDCTIAQDFLLMVGSSQGRSNENAKVQIAVKNQDPAEITIQQPMIISGNDFPRTWQDTGGRLRRRIFGILFDKKVSQPDPFLSAKLDNELPSILVGLTRAYHALVRCANGLTMRNIMPKDLQRDRDLIMRSSSLVRDFCNPDNGSPIRYDSKGAASDLVIPLDILLNEFSIFKARRLGERYSTTMVTPEEFKELMSFTKAKPLEFFSRGHPEDKKHERVKDCPIWPGYPVKVRSVSRDEKRGLSQAPVTEIFRYEQIRFPFIDRLGYRPERGSAIAFNDSSEPRAYLVGIALRWDKISVTRAIQYNAQADRPGAGDDGFSGGSRNKWEISPDERRKYWFPFFRCKGLRDLARLDPTIYGQDVIDSILAFKRALENSHTRTSLKQAPSEDSRVEDKASKRMLRLENAHVRSGRLIFSRHDQHVVDVLLGKNVGGRRVSGKFKIDGSNGVSTQFGGMLDLEKASRGIFSMTDAQVHRHMRFEFLGLYTRVCRYAEGAAGDDRKRLQLVANELKSFYSAWILDSEDAYDVKIV